MIQRKVVEIYQGSIDTGYGGSAHCTHRVSYVPLVIPRRGRAAACKIYLGADKDAPMYAMRGIYARTVKYKPTWKE